MSKLATIGYESASLDDFITTLKKVGVEIIVDVRELAQSRRKGFSKKALSAALELNGIDYIHLKGLGDPKEGRDAARSGDYRRFLQIFTDHLASEAAKADMQRAIEIATDSFACLLCYERSSKECHRRLVADELSDKLNFEVMHVGVRHGISGNGKARRA